MQTGKAAVFPERDPDNSFSGGSARCGRKSKKNDYIYPSGLFRPTLKTTAMNDLFSSFMKRTLALIDEGSFFRKPFR